MLKKVQISPFEAYSDPWYEARLGKFTSSRIYTLMGETPNTAGALSYIRQKVGEELTGEAADKEIDTDATRWGHFYETEAIRKFAQAMELDFVVVQHLIMDLKRRCASTPDFLIPLRESPDHTEYEVEPGEVKCPPTYDAYISLFECDTPQQLKKVKKEYYWQTLDQMEECGATRGHFVIYHPKFKVGNRKNIVFDAMQQIKTEKRPYWPLKDDLNLLRERKDWAEREFNRIREILMHYPAA